MVYLHLHCWSFKAFGFQPEWRVSTMNLLEELKFNGMSINWTSEVIPQPDAIRDSDRV